MADDASAVTVATADLFVKAVHKRRLCGDMSTLMDHVKCAANTAHKNGRICAACGKKTTSVCTIYNNVPLCITTKRGKEHAACFVQYHDNGYFGLLHCDWKWRAQRKRDWCFPTESEVHANSIGTNKMRLEVERETDGDEENEGNED